MTDFVLLGILADKHINWMTPLWLMGVGVLAGLVLLAALWGLVALLSMVPGLGAALGLRRIVAETGQAIQEGPLFHIYVIAGVLGVFGIVGTFILRSPAESIQLVGSLARVTQTGIEQQTFTIPRSDDPQVVQELVPPPALPVDVEFRTDEVRQFQIRSTENVSVSRDPEAQMDTMDSIEVRAGEPMTWIRGKFVGSPFGEENVTQLFVRNRGTGPAELTVVISTDLAYPQVRSIPITALALTLLSLFYFVLRAAMPRMTAVALATFKSEIAQPLFAILAITGLVALFMFIFIPYNTFGEDIKMLKDSGLVLVKIFAVILAVWGASTTISEEIEGRTALTVLSKPIGRRSFVLGKFLGIGWTTAVMYVLLGVFLLAVVSYKTIYDAREASRDLPTWDVCYLEVTATIPGLALGYMETLVLASLSVAISTRLPMLANFVICFTVYVLGHLTPLIVQVTDERFEIVKFFGQLIATVFPNLEAFDVQSAVATGFAVPAEYLAWSLLYCVLFSVIAMLLALLLFEDRDLA